MAERLTGEVVTATAFVRNFGAYTRLAGQHPVHILNHGRPAWSLVPTDYLSKLSDAGDKVQDPGLQALDMFLDAIATPIIITDRHLNIARINPASRHALKVTAEAVQSAPLDKVLLEYRSVVQAAERVLASGVPEMLEVDMVTTPVRTFRVRIEQFDEGVAIISEETTLSVVARERHARAAEYECLIDALPSLARGMINGRGLISQATEHLADLVQSSADRVVGMRLSSLFHNSVRLEVGEAVETLLSERKGFTLDAVLQANGAATVPVVLTALPTLSNSRDDRGTFLISERPA